MLRKIIVIIGTLYSCTLFAADERGNGGDAVVCRDQNGNIVSAEVLDHYEARTQLGISSDVGLTNRTVNEAVLNVIDRLADFDATRKANYRRWAQEFDSDSVFLRGVSLVDVPDSAHIAIPAGCAVEQLALQRTPAFPRQKRYTINMDIWDHLDDENKVILILHEIIYRDALESGHINSLSTRYFTAVLSEAAFSEMSDAEYAELLVNMNFRIEEECDDVHYLRERSNYSSYHDNEPFCYIPGSKEELSESTFSAILTRPFKLRSDVEVRWIGQYLDDDSGLYPQYQSKQLEAFSEVTVKNGLTYMQGQFVRRERTFSGYYSVDAEITFLRR